MTGAGRHFRRKGNRDDQQITRDYGRRLPNLPITAGNVTASLSRATINENPHSPHFMQVDLAHLYTSTDPADYPLSFTSYLIVPRLGTRLPVNFTKAKGRALSTFLRCALCSGQRQLSGLGYAPLPANLVKGGLLQVANIPGHVAVPAECPAAARS